MCLDVQFECEDDGRWVAEVSALLGVIACGASREEARRAVLALRVIADRLEHGEPVPPAALEAFAA